MENLKLLFQIYFRPASAFSEIMDQGSWLFAAIAVLLVSFAFQYSVNSSIMKSYEVSQPTYYQLDEYNVDGDIAPVSNPTIDDRADFPVLGKSIQWLFRFDSSFFTPLISLSVFYFPATIILLALFGSLGTPGTVLRRDYATLSTCSLMAWVAAHLPFAVVAFLLKNVSGSVYLGFWLASGLIFGGLMIFVLRTVFGVEYGPAILTIAISWIFYSLGGYVFQFISPWLFSPFLLFFAIIYLGGYLGSEVRGLGNSMRQKRNLKRFLENATINPNDADAHLQLGLIYQKRRQHEKALEHFTKAVEIDGEEIDANYELGKIARTNKDLQKAIEHFSVVVEQDETYSSNEVWREIGATYLEAEMFNEAQEALERFELKRPFDAEGLYYLGTLHKKKGESEKAREMFERVIEAVKTAAYYRRSELQKWARMAKKEI
ncbi:MAG: tetratricopeptide repeat protein [Pyrinomonadaceae bacterium]|nr:tetratricopeptide repeat protein [Pyrinomonadaceae bacterium]